MAFWKGPLKNLLRDLVPPLLPRLHCRVVKGSGYFGHYRTWDEAKNASMGYDADLILDKVREASLKVKRGEAAYERDSVLFTEVHYAWPLLAGLLWIASQNDNQLSVADFGGALGSSYYQNKKFLGHLDTVRWSIIEQERFVACGRQFFADEQVRFYENLEDCLAEQAPQVMLMSSVLPYLENPYELLQRIIDKRFPFLIIDRTPLLGGSEDRLTVQKVPAEIYRASYPAWILSKGKLLRFLGSAYGVVAEFPALAGKIDLGDDTAWDTGFILKREMAERGPEQGAGGTDGAD